MLKARRWRGSTTEARWLGQEVGRLRDLDVVTNEFVRREAEAHPDEPGLTGPCRLALPAGGGTDAVTSASFSSRVVTQALLIDLARFVETRGWLVPEDFGQTERLAQPVVELAGKALNKRSKKVRKCAHGLEALTVEQRHELRKELKKLRYAVEFFLPLYRAKRVDPFLKRLKKLQTVFGDLNDARRSEPC